MGWQLGRRSGSVNANRYGKLGGYRVVEKYGGKTIFAFFECGRRGEGGGKNK